MNEPWTFLQDNEWPDQAFTAVEALVSVIRSMGCGTATSAALTSNDQLLAMATVATIDLGDRVIEIASVLDLTEEMISPLLAWRPAEDRLALHPMVEAKEEFFITCTRCGGKGFEPSPTGVPQIGAPKCLVCGGTGQRRAEEEKVEGR